MACPKVEEPGRPNRLKIVVGIVGRCGRTRNDVAPNSPSASANENADPARTAFAMIG